MVRRLIVSSALLICWLAVFNTITVKCDDALPECPPACTFTGEASGDYFGQSVASAGDVNGDGFADLIVGAYGREKAYVYSSQTGCMLYVLTGEASGDYFGESVASAGDVNGDGFADLIVGAWANDAGGDNAGRVYVYSGQSGDVLHVFTGEAEGGQFGRSVASAGDVNDDGYADLIVGAYAYHTGDFIGRGRVYVFSGLTGDTLHVFTGEDYSAFGISVASAGDVNNDGFADLIVGASVRSYVFSGPTGDTLYVFTGDSANLFGGVVGAAGDVDADGYDDVIIAAHWDIGFFWVHMVGCAHVYSGRTGESLYIFPGEGPESYFDAWISIGLAGDVDNDGFADLIVGAGHTNEAYVFSGQTGDTMHVFVGEAAGDYFGMSVGLAGDVNSDGYSDLIVGACWNSAGGDRAGRAYVFSGSGCVCGDANGDMQVTSDDMSCLMEFYFGCSRPPFPYMTGDLNCDGSVDIADIIHLQQYINGVGPEPCCMQ